MRHQLKPYVWAVCLALALPLSALAALKFTTFAKTGAADTTAFSINDDGVIVGTYDQGIDTCGAGEPIQHGFVTKDKGKHIHTIEFPGATKTAVTGISDEGAIVGVYETLDSPPCGVADHAFLLEKGKFTTLNLPTTVAPDHLGINANGDVVGDG